MKRETRLFLASLSWRHHNFLNKSYQQLSQSVLEEPDILKWPSLVNDKYISSLLLNIKAFKREFDKELSWCEKNGVSLVCFEDESYPENLRHYEDAPPLLSILGKAPPNDQPLFCAVGSRQCDVFAKSWCLDHLEAFFEKKKVNVISGGAFGVDQLVHLLALKNNRPSWAVLPSGIDAMYPSELRKYKDLFLEQGGGFISSFSPFASLKKFYFFKRNLTLSRFSNLTLVVQAQRKSGTYMTGRMTLEEGRPVAALPFFPSQKGLGNLDLIANGAYLIRDQEDLIVLWDLLLSKKVL